MRKFLNTLFVLSENAFLSLDGENVLVKKDNSVAGRFPLHTFENILMFSYMGASPAFMGKCAEDGIGLSFFSPQGKFLARTVGRLQGNVLLRKEQYRISENEERSSFYARNMILGKVYNCRWVLERFTRDHKQRINSDRIKGISVELNGKLKRISTVEGLDSIRGVEGEAATRYFSVFNELILNQKNEFLFNGRNRRPPTDYVNALLSFSYSLLANECANALEGVGLDSYVGFLHRDRPGRKSLALDLMEELRPVIGDRFVLSMINLKVIQSNHFVVQQDGAVYLNDEGKKVFLANWHSKQKEELTHPFLKEKIVWGLVPHIQALLLARTIRGDLNEYPPFLWK